MEKPNPPARRAAGALIVAFAKRGTIQGSFIVPEMVRIIDQETGLPELVRACAAALVSVNQDLALIDLSRMPPSEARRLMELRELLEAALAKAQPSI